MPTGTFDYRSDGERRAIERAIAFVAEMHDLAQTAPDGQVLGLCEAQALGQGRDLLRATLQAGRAGRGRGRANPHQRARGARRAPSRVKGRRGARAAEAGCASSGAAAGSC